jgi:hypothetical protein
LLESPRTLHSARNGGDDGQREEARVVSGSHVAGGGKRGTGLSAAIVCDSHLPDPLGAVRIAMRGDRDGADRAADRSACVVADQHSAERPTGRRPDDQQVRAAVGAELVQTAAHRGGEHAG